MNTHLCKSTCNVTGTRVSTRHVDLASAVAAQKEREAAGHYGVVVMPVPYEELTDDYPQPTPATMTKEPRHRNEAPKRERAKVAA